MEGFVNVRGHQVHYVEYGHGKPVFNIHGYEVDHRMMTGALVILGNLIGQVINERIDPRVRNNEATEISEVEER